MAFSPQAIVTSDAPKVRYEKLKAITVAVLAETDAPATASKREWILWTFLYIMWHEGEMATKRAQSGSGPGRGFMQFEPDTLQDLLAEYVFGPTAGLLQNLADAAGVTKAVMQEALKDFRDHGNFKDKTDQVKMKTWPNSGPAAQVQTWLAGTTTTAPSDTFGVLLMRYQFKRYTAHTFPGDKDGFPVGKAQDADWKGTNAVADDLNTHSGHWAKHWKKSFGSDADKKTKKQTFLDHAKDLDTVAAP